MTILSIHTCETQYSRGTRFHCQADDNDQSPGFTWIARFGFVAQVLVDNPQAVMRGTNTRNLTFMASFIDRVSYPAFQCNCSASSIEILSVGAWILGSFESIDGVIFGLKSKCFYGNDEIPLQFTVEDIAGNNLTVQFKNGTLVPNVTSRLEVSGPTAPAWRV